MTVTLWGEVGLTVEAALSSSTGGYGAWGGGVWGSVTWGPSETWTDISQWVRRLSCTRRFAREVQAWEAGRASLVLDNRDGRFSADNLAGPYVVAGVSGVRPLRPVRVTATVGGVTYPVMRMHATDWIESWTVAPAGQGDAIVTVPCADELARLAAVDNPAVGATGAGELFGARIHRWLDSARHAGVRTVDVGTTTMQATTLASNVVTGLKLTADSEGGAVWIGAAGEVIAASQYALTEAERSVSSQATFGDAAGEVPYSAIEISSAGDHVINVASYARVGGTAQLAADATSRALYGDRTDVRTDLICETDAQAAALAAWKVARFRAPERRVTSVTVDARRGDVPWSVALGLRVRDLVTVIRRPPGGHTITQYCHIAGIGHQVTPSHWKTTFYLSSATPYVQFSSSRWGVGVWDSAVWFM